MFQADHLLAVVLLTAAPEAPLPATLAVWQGPLRPALIQAGLDSEVLDPREVPQYFLVDEGMPRDLRVLQSRFQELAFAPLLVECERFPIRKQVQDFLASNRDYRFDLAQRLAVDRVHADELQATLRETDELYQIWDVLRDSRCEFYYISVRRRALSQLRDLIGLEAFYRGTMPPSLPVWRIAILR